LENYDVNPIIPPINIFTNTTTTENTIVLIGKTLENLSKNGYAIALTRSDALSFEEVEEKSKKFIEMLGLKPNRNGKHFGFEDDTLSVTFDNNIVKNWINADTLNFGLVIFTQKDSSFLYFNS